MNKHNTALKCIRRVQIKIVYFLLERQILIRFSKVIGIQKSSIVHWQVFISKIVYFILERQILIRFSKVIGIQKKFHSTLGSIHICIIYQ